MNTLQTIALYYNPNNNFTPGGILILVIVFGILLALQPKNRRRK